MENKKEINEVDDSSSMESVLVDHGYDGIVEELTGNITRKLLNHSPLPASCCIFRVPHQIRRQKEQAYEPDIVSIGPFHSDRRGDQFQLMENVKRWYLQCLLSHPNITLETLIKGVVDLDKRARDCYAEPLDLNKKDFAEMMVLDGCFLIELFRKGISDQHDENDPVFNLSGMRLYLYHDLLLLENQLPWFVLERLYNLTAVKNATSEGNASSLYHLVLNFFRNSAGDNGILNTSAEDDHPRKLILHILDLIRSAIVDSFKVPRPWRTMPSVPSVTTLSVAGIKFEKSSKSPVSILDIRFEKGVITMPQLVIDERTGPLFRNLIAFEQCCHSRPHLITCYAVLMDNLINSCKDIDLLCEKKILANWLSPEDTAQFFNELCNETTVIGSCYGELCDQVTKFYDTKWNKWMEKLRREHFDSPWTIISLVAAFILLVLTLLQTVYTIHQYHHPLK